jgi:uncharacterized protein (TIGR02145 family)
MLNGIEQKLTKGNGYGVRACRSFISSTNYNIRDLGPAGGYIFIKTDNLNGTFTYYELAPSDCETHRFSNLYNPSDYLGTGSAIGTGQANTLAIIGQAGHTDSAAKLCDDLVAGGWIDDTVGAYCWYDNDIANKTPYGALYNWYAVNNVHGLAPTGWRIPSDTDWNTFITFLGGDAVAGGKLKEIGLTHWETPNMGATDDYGFNGLGSGYRDASEIFTDFNRASIFHGSNEVSQCSLYYNNTDINFTTLGNKIPGKSIRCMRDI